MRVIEAVDGSNHVASAESRTAFQPDPGDLAEIVAGRNEPVVFECVARLLAPDADVDVGDRADTNGLAQGTEVVRAQRVVGDAVANRTHRRPFRRVNVEPRVEPFGADAAARLAKCSGHFEGPVHRRKRPQQRSTGEAVNAERGGQWRRR